MSQAPQPRPTDKSPDQLIRLGIETARGGNRQAARTLFLALARERPDDVRVWIGLAGVAASRNEQREALERIIALDPGNKRAQLALQRLVGTPVEAARNTVVLPETLTPEPNPAPVAAPRDLYPAVGPTDTTPPDDDAPQHAPFPLLNILALGLILLLLGILGVIIGRAFLDDAPGTAVTTATPSLLLQPGAGTQVAPSASAPTPASAPTTDASLATPAQPEPTLVTGVDQGAGGQVTPPPALTGTTGAQQGATPAPTAGQSLSLPMGTPIDYDGWTAVLVSPDYALPLDGAIGDLQPTGRFVLTVVAVSNNSPTPRVIPLDLFALVDSTGRSYTPVPGASTAYLALYERAQRGDLALEDTFDPVVGLRSVPLIFDLPFDAAGLRLTVKGAGPAGWPVGEQPPPSAPVGP